MKPYSTSHGSTRPCPAGVTRAGFTLIELLTVIAIIGILAAILIPTVAMVRKKARTSECASRLRQWGQAVNLYAVENKGVYLWNGWASGGANGPYWPYFRNGEVLRDIRFCPAHPTSGVSGSVHYVFARPQPKSNDSRVLLNKAKSPSRLLVMIDSTQNAGGNVTGLPNLLTNTYPLLDASEAEPDRHGSVVNALFADCHVSAVHWAAESPSDPLSITAMAPTTWFLYDP